MERFLRRPLDFFSAPYRRQRILYKLHHEHNSSDVLSAIRDIKTPDDLLYVNTVLNEELSRRKNEKPKSIHIEIPPEPVEPSITDIRLNLYGINSPGWQHSVDVLLVHALLSKDRFNLSALSGIEHDFTPWQQGLLTSLCYWYGSSWHRQTWLPDMTNGMYAAMETESARSEYTTALSDFSVPYRVGNEGIVFEYYFGEVHE